MDSLVESGLSSPFGMGSDGWTRVEVKDLASQEEILIGFDAAESAGDVDVEEVPVVNSKLNTLVESYPLIAAFAYQISSTKNCQTFDL